MTSSRRFPRKLRQEQVLDEIVLVEVEPDAVGRSTPGRIVDKLVGGSRELLLTQLVEEPEVGGAELNRVRKILDERLTESGGTR